MIHKDQYMVKYQAIIENLVSEYPKDKELVKSVFEGSIKNNKFALGAKMAAKLVNAFEEPSFALTQVQLLYMDSQNGGSPLSLQFACAFAEKYLKNLKDEPIPTYFSNLWLKLLHAKKDYK